MTRPGHVPALVLLAAALLTAPCSLSRAQGASMSSASEYAVKSALLFKLPQFVYQAQTGRKGNLTICLLGNAPFENSLEKLAQAPIDGQTVSYKKLPAAGEASECNFVFIARSEAGNLEAILRRMGKSQVVTVSDIAGFAQSGGMVELALGGEGTAVSILINRKAAQKQEIEFNAQLLRLARIVEP